MDEATKYPLAWPFGWPRSARRERAGQKFRGVTFDRARRGLMAEIARLGGTNIVLSTNQPVRPDGAPYAARNRLDDPGVAVYFNYNGRPTAMCRDAFQEIEANIRSLAMAIEGLRMLERHGGGKMLDKAFEGFIALPAPGDIKPRRSWRAVLGLRGAPTAAEVDAAYKRLAKQYHPDNPDTGNAESFKEVAEAKEFADKELALT